MHNMVNMFQKIDWQRPFASSYFRSAGSYLGLRLVIFTLCGLASQYLLTHNLKVEDYGLLVWIGTFIALLSPFGLPGISTSITGAVAKGYDENFRRGTWLQIIGGTLGGMVLLAIGGYYWFWQHQQIKALIFIIAGVLGPGLWLNTHQCYWNGKKNFKAIFWLSVSVRIIQLFSIAIVLYFSTNPLFVFGAQTSIMVAGNIVTPILIIKIAEINKEFSKKYQSYGWFYTLLNSIGILSTCIDKLIIGIFFGLEALAVFSVGQLIYTYIYVQPSSILGQIFLPRLAEMEIKEAAIWIKRRRLYIIAMMIVLVMIVGIAIPVVYPILFSIKYNESIFYAYLFLGCIVLGSPVILSESLIKSHAMKKETTEIWSIFALTPLISIPVFSWLFGLKGIVLARGLTNLLGSVYLIFLTKKLSSNDR